MHSPIGILMIVSPNELEMAVDSLRRALRHVPSKCHLFLTNNGVSTNLRDSLDSPEFLGHEVTVFTPPGKLPRPYFEIARTVVSSLREIGPVAPELIFKIDPDTLVLDDGFFTDIQLLRADSGADFVACHSTSSIPDLTRRTVRLAVDSCRFGFGRSCGRDRYGSMLGFRGRPVWFRGMLPCIPSRRQPSGGFYALSGAFLRKLESEGLLQTAGENGLEWNDDTLIPIAVRALGGNIVDVRQSKFSTHWRWLHGSRYFSVEQAQEPGLRAVHPVKLDSDGKLLRRLLDTTPRSGN